MYQFRLFALCSVLLMSTAIARGERKFDFGSQYDFSFGGTNQSGSTQIQQSLAPFYGFYPSVNMQSAGRRSMLNLSYTALLERFNGDQKINSFAHVLHSGFAVNAGPRFRLNFSGSFSSAPDYTFVQVLQGFPTVPDANFVYQPAIGKSTMKTFRGGAGAELDLSYRSYVTFDFSTWALNHEQNSTITGTFVDQRRKEGRLGYWYRFSAHQSIDLQYAVITNDYAELGRGRTQAAVIGLTRQFSPALDIHVQAGPAYVTYDNIPGYYGYVLSASLTRKIRSSNIAGYYSHTPGDSSGLGTLSNLHAGGISIFSPFWKRMELGTSLSAFTSRGAIDGSNRYRGFYGTVNISYPLSPRWFVAWGGSYRWNVYDNAMQQEYKRLFMSIRFRAPELWRTSL